MQNQDQYQNYSAQDFLADTHFRKWVLSSDKESDYFWNSFRTLHPHKEKELEKARQILLQLHSEQRYVKQETVELDWQKLRQAILQEERTAPASVRYLRPWLAAAVISLLVLAGTWAWFVLPSLSQTVYTTSYGETKQLLLPDSSVVIVNANSRLAYNNNWEEGETREVWLQGEAYFEVEKIEAGRPDDRQKVKFIVHTSELQVEVVGTEFSVNTRTDKTQVTLNSGKVIVKDKQDETMEMLPGEQVELSHLDQKLVKKKVIPENYTSWKDNNLEFVNMPVPEILQMLEDRYGWQIEVNDPDFLNNHYKGSAPAEAPEVLLQKWQLVYQLDITKQDNKVIINTKDSK